MDDRKERLEEIRKIPLEQVLGFLGATQSKSDKKNWVTEVGRISLSGEKFFNHDTGKGGGGAIDLVCQIKKVESKPAILWLKDNFGSQKSNHQKIEKKETIFQKSDWEKIHQRSDDTWPKAKKYLVNIRGISERLVDDLYSHKYVYSDSYQNLVFVLGGGKGISLRGTGEKKFHGTRGEKGLFILGAKDKQNCYAAFVESPIDALSLRELGFSGRIIATIGNFGEIVSNKVAFYRKEGLKIVSAFDNDLAGENMSKVLGEHIRLRPKHKDWNVDLIEKKRVFLEKSGQRDRLDRGIEISF